MYELLEILYQDDALVAINKPHGLLVHKTGIAANASVYALQLLRNQLGQYVYPAHRIDRKTAGVLLFGLTEESQRNLMQQFAHKEISKTYYAIVRGYAPDQGVINYPLRKENGQLQEAVTEYECLARTEIPLPFGKHDTSRYSFVKAMPQTGRMHQIRKHFAHIFHPIIGDRPHGCNKQNKLFKEKWQMDTMMLHAAFLAFKHPISGEIISVRAALQPEFVRCMKLLNFDTLKETELKT